VRARGTGRVVMPGCVWPRDGGDLKGDLVIIPDLLSGLIRPPA